MKYKTITVNGKVYNSMKINGKEWLIKELTLKHIISASDSPSLLEPHLQVGCNLKFQASGRTFELDVLSWGINPLSGFYEVKFNANELMRYEVGYWFYKKPSELISYSIVGNIAIWGY